jgi:glycosyltransferase involved in cell wall biosynthesis
MKIVMHCLYFPPEIGGLESHVFHLCKGLVEAGCDVSIVTSCSQEGLLAEEEIEGIRVFRTWLPQRSAFGWTAHAIGSMPRLIQLSAHADVVHGQSFQSVLPAYAARRINEIPMVTSWHTSHFLKKADELLWKPIFREFLRSSQHNFTASIEIADVAKSLAPDAMIEAIPNGVDTQIFQPSANMKIGAKATTLIVPRRLYEKNGVEFFIRAMPLIAEAIDVRALIVGDGPEKSRLEELALSLGMQSKIEFLGKREHSEIPKLLNSADIAIFPSLMEATSVAALEAMACGIPVVASDVGGLPELVDNDVGGLFRPRDSRSLAETVLSLVSRNDFHELGSRARQRVVEKWSNQHLVNRHLDTYQSIIDSWGDN